MNRHIARALVEDALYQVLDNKIFRVLVVMAIVMIAPTFLISFGETEVSVLFGWKVFTYADLRWLMAGVNPASKDAQIRAIQALQSLVVESLAGNFGILLCLSATAFFVPRMLEKGEADTLFSKPVGRFVLLFSRYLSGVLFVGVLAFLLVLGMHVGLLLRSGYSDPGFLWGALTLVYVFAIVHAFSTVVGVFTRSSVTALLVSILFYGANGCAQSLWIMKEHGLAQAAEARDAGEDSEMAHAAEEMEKPLWSFLFGTLDTIHYVMPKTSDADVLTRKLRIAMTGGEWVIEDKVGQLALDREPIDMTRASEAVEVDTSTNPVVWSAGDDARITLSRRSRLVERTIGDKTRPGRTSTNSAAAELLKSLEARKDLEGKPTRVREATVPSARDGVRWQVQEDGRARVHVRHFVAVGDWMHEVELDADPKWLEAHPTVLVQFLAGLKPQRESAAELPSEAWYEKRFGWAAPMKFNAFFSLGTSLLFGLALMFLARWRLSRIDF